ncbi:VOC family protein [Leptospira sp. WS92.C1]
MKKIAPFLRFDGKLEKAMNFYTYVFKNSTIQNDIRNVNTASNATFQLDGRPMFTFNPTILRMDKIKTLQQVYEN